MKRLTDLDDFFINTDEDLIESQGVTNISKNKGAPEKVKFRFSVTQNLKKVARIQKSLIDTSQLLLEMADEIVALKINYPNMDPESMEVMNNMAYNLKNLIDRLKIEHKSGSRSGMFDNIGRLKRNMEKIKTDYTTNT